MESNVDKKNNMKENNSFLLHGDIVYSETLKDLRAFQNAYVVCDGAVSGGVYASKDKIPEKYRALPVMDFAGKLIIPGMVDLHIHAPQFNYRGTGMDLELIPWLNNYTFPEELKFEDTAYAKSSYSLFADSMKKSATTRACIFATVHRKSTEILMDLMEKSGLVSYIGKINMDRESIEGLQEKSFLDSAFQTFGWINDITNHYKNTYPIITPRFVPSCSDELMNELREILLTYHLPVQSHLSENPDEVRWVKQLCPDTEFYGQAYDKYDMFGSLSKVIMAHSVYSGTEEVELMRKNGVYVAHCPASNMNISSGIAPIRKYLDKGIKVGLGSDVAGGESESIFRAIVQAVQISKLYWRLVDKSSGPVTFAEAFYMATKGGGEFFGKVGGFEKGYEFDALVIDDASQPYAFEMSVPERLERSVYLSMDLTAIAAKYVRGNRLL